MIAQLFACFSQKLALARKNSTDWSARSARFCNSAMCCTVHMIEIHCCARENLCDLRFFILQSCFSIRPLYIHWAGYMVPDLNWGRPLYLLRKELFDCFSFWLMVEQWSSSSSSSHQSAWGIPWDNGGEGWAVGVWHVTRMVWGNVVRKFV